MYFSWPLIICLVFISVIIRNLLFFVPRSTQDGVALGSLSDLGHHSSRVERVEYIRPPVLRVYTGGWRFIYGG